VTITYGGALTNGQDTGNAQYTTASVTPIAGTVTFAFFQLNNNTVNNVTLTGCNLKWTVIYPSGVKNLILGWGVGTSPTAGTIKTVGSDATSGIWSVFYMKGVDNYEPIIQYPTASGTGTTGSVNMATYQVNRNNVVIGCNYITNNVSVTPTSNFTEIHEITINSARRLQTQYGLGKFSPFSATFGSSSGWRTWGIELREELGDFFNIL